MCGSNGAPGRTAIRPAVSVRNCARVVRTDLISMVTRVLGATRTGEDATRLSARVSTRFDTAYIPGYFVRFCVSFAVLQTSL